MQKRALVFGAAVASLSTAMPAHAYIDPGTGSLIVQSIIGGAAAAMTIGSMYITRVRCFFSRLLGRGETDPHAGPRQ